MEIDKNDLKILTMSDSLPREGDIGLLSYYTFWSSKIGVV
jgi:hypothetical protein